MKSSSFMVDGKIFSFTALIAHDSGSCLERI